MVHLTDSCKRILISKIELRNQINFTHVNSKANFEIQTVVKNLDDKSCLEIGKYYQVKYEFNF